MKIEAKIQELTSEELVTFLSDATYGDSTFTIHLKKDEVTLKLDKEYFDNCKQQNKQMIFEEHLAHILLGGGTLIFEDNEDGEEVELTIDRIKETFSNILSGHYKKPDSDNYYILQNFINCMITHEGDFYDAYNILQVCLFDEVVYG